jgi:hypothetical protein
LRARLINPALKWRLSRDSDDFCKLLFCVRGELRSPDKLKHVLLVSRAEMATAVSRELKAGRLRKLAPRLYTRNLKDPPENSRIGISGRWWPLTFPAR